MIFFSLADKLREISSGLLLVQDDYSEINRNKKRFVKPTVSVSVTKDKGDGKEDKKEIPIKKAKPDEFSKIKVTKRPVIKPPRRISDFRAKWKGQGSREVRKEYQENYRKEHGNGYAKKIKTSGNVIKVVNHQGMFLE